MDLTDEIAKRVKKWLEGKPQNPIKLQFNPTDRCNLGCIFCWQRDSFRINYKNELSKERYIQLIKEAADSDIKSIEIISIICPQVKDIVTDISEITCGI